MSVGLKKRVPNIIIAVVALSLLLIGVLITRGPAPVPLTEKERAWLRKNNGLIRLAPCPGWEPMEFFDESGYRGMVADYIRLIERKLDIRFKIVEFDSWSRILSEAKLNNVDVIAAAHPTPERWTFMNWTEPYLEFPAVVITRKADRRQLIPENMSGMNVGVCRDYVVESYLATTYPDIRLFPVPDGVGGLEKVSFGELDAMVLELPNAFYNIEQHKITNLRMAGKTQWVARYGIGTR
ncbi:MAG: transporter substrate-binding domain-containing protein, partial [Desulfobacterales bacterium]|nr:transporter substrate-binding domain-containing protein [Desulfobacterales bacterium]